MNSPTFGSGFVTGSAVEDQASVLSIASQTFSFTDLGRDTVLGPDAQGLLITPPSNAIGTFSATILDDAPGIGGDTEGTVRWEYSVDSSVVQHLSEGEVLTQVYQVEVVDQDGNTLVQPITITITGTNDRPVISAGVVTASLTEDATATLGANGSISFTDADTGITPASADLLTASKAVQGVHWSAGPMATEALSALQTALDAAFSLSGAGVGGGANSGTVNWTLALPSTAVDFLDEGQTLTVTYRITVTDDSGVALTNSAYQDITITLTGTNDVPTLAATTVNYTDTAADDAASILTQDGTLPAADLDTTDVLTYAIEGPTSLSTEVGYNFSQTSAYGTLHLNTATGAYRFIPDAAAIQGLSANAAANFIVRVNDGSGPVTSTLTIAIAAANDTAVITGAIDGTIFEAGGLNNSIDSNLDAGVISGNLNHTDADAADADDDWVQVTGTQTANAYGTFSMGSNGAWIYTLDNNNAAVQGLKSGQILTETFTVQTTGGTQQVVTITITGANDAAVITGVASDSVIEAGNGVPGDATATGDLNHTDVDTDDADDAWVAQTDVADTYGTFSITEAGVWTYTLDNSLPATQALAQGASVTRTFTVETTDGTETTVSVSINGSNDAPTVTAAGTTTGGITEPTGTGNYNLSNANLSGNFGVADVDSGAVLTVTHSGPVFAWSGGTFSNSVVSASAQTAIQNAFTASITGGTVNWAFDAATSTNISLNALAEGETLTATFNVTVSDGLGGTVVQPVVITFTGTNDAPTGTEDWSFLITEGQQITTGDGAGGTTTDALNGTLTGGTHQVVVVDNAVSGTVGESNATFAIAYSDADLTDTGHTVAVSVVSATAGNGATVPVGANYATFMTPSLAVSSAGNSGQINWTFTAPDTAFDFLAHGETLTIVYRFTVTDENNASTISPDRTITVTVTGTNDAPTITASSGAVVTEDGTVAGTASISGSLAGALGVNWVDKDASHDPVLAVTMGSAGSAAQAGLTFSTLTPPGGSEGQYATINGTFGTLYLKADGSYIYILDNADADTQALDGGVAGFDNFNYTIADPTGASTFSNLMISVVGANDGPVLGTLVNPAAVAEVTNVSTQDINLTGSFDVSDVDANDTLAISVGTPVVAMTGTSATVPPGLAAALAEALSASSTVNSASGASGLTIGWTFTANELNLDFLNAGDSITVTFPISVTDGTANSAVQNLVITINGTNDGPVAVADAAAVVEAGGTANGTAGTATATGNVITDTAGRDTDVDQDAVITVASASSTNLSGTAQTVVTGSPTVIAGRFGTLTLNADGSYSYALADADTDTQALDTGANGTEVFSITVTDEHGAQSTANLTITITGTNDAPVLAAITDTHNFSESFHSNTSWILNSGQLFVSDADSADTLTASTGTPTVLLDGQPFTLPAGAAALIAANAITFSGPQTSNSGAVQSVTWSIDCSPDLNFLRAGQILTIRYPVTFSDGTDTSNTEYITLSITGSNDGPVAVADVTSQVAGVIVKEAGDEPVEAGQPNASGNVLANDTDLDAGDSKTVINAGTTAATEAVGTGSTSAAGGTVITGTYGTLTIGADGSWSYVLNDADADTQALAAGQLVADTFTYTMVDGFGASSTTTLKVNIEGSNDGPTITSGPVTAALNEGLPGGAPSASGLLAFTDPDANDRPGNVAVDADATVSVALAVTGPTLTPEQTAAANALLSAFTAGPAMGATNTGNIAWSFAPTEAAVNFLRESQQVTLTFTLTLNDGNGGSDSQTITLTLTGTNDAVALGTPTKVDGGVTEPVDGAVPPATLTETGSFTFTDPDLAANPVQLLNYQGLLLNATNTSQWGGTLTQVTTLTNAATTEKTLVWTYSIDPANPNLQALGAGETLTETFTARVLDQSGGGFLTQVITITLTGTNDRPVITATAEQLAETVSEGAGATLTATDTISFADADVGIADNPATLANETRPADLSTVTETLQDVVWADGPTPLLLSPATAMALDAALNTAFSVSGDGVTTGANTGTVTWSFNLAQTAVDFLAAGETLTVTYRITVTDDSGDAATNAAFRDVVITLTGTNDAPVISGAVASASVADVAETSDAAASAALLSANDSISFTDADLTDVHTATVTAVDYVSGDLGGATLEALQALMTASVDTIDREIDWSFSAAESLFDHLRAGDTLILSYTVTLSDGNGGTATKLVTITINGANDTPYIGATSVTAQTVVEAGNLDNGTVVAGTPSATGTIVGIDVDAGSTAQLDYSGSTTGSFGSFVIDDETGVWTYTLNQSLANALKEGETRTETFTVTVSDGPNSVTQDVVITISGTNDAPTIESTMGTHAGTVTEDGTITATGTVGTALDVDQTAGVSLVWSVNNPSPYGTMVIDPVTSEWTFTLGSGAQALLGGQVVTETFTATVTDEFGATATHQITITINGANDVPVINVGSSTVSGSVEDPGERPPTLLGPVAGTLTATGTMVATDADLNQTAGLTWSVVGTPSSTYGTFAITAAGVWTFTLNPALANSLGEAEAPVETFVVRVSDGVGGFADQQITVTINGTNDAPEINVASSGITGTVIESSVNPAPSSGATATGTMNATDPDTGDTLAWSIVGSGTGTYGNLTLVNNVWTYTLTDTDADTQALVTGDTGTETFTLRVTDLSGVSRDQTITINVSGRNEVFNGDAADDLLPGTGTADSIFGNGGDDTLTGGSGDDELFGGIGDDSLVGGSDNDQISGGAGSDIIEGNSGTDTLLLEGDWADYLISFAAGAYTFYNSATTDTDRATGIELVSFNGGPAVAIATVLNDGPVAANDSGFTLLEDGSQTIAIATLLANDTDADAVLGDVLSFSLGSATGGTVVVDNGTVIFTPNPNYNGPASFTYTVTDIHGAMSTATVSLTVTAVNDVPTVGAATASGTEDAVITGTVEGADADGEALTYAISGTAPAGLTFNTNGTWSYDPTTLQNGLDDGETATVTFSYTANDGTATSAPATVTITVDGVNDAPTVAAALELTPGLSEDGSLTIGAAQLLAGASDVDDESLTVTGLTASSGTLVDNGNGTWTFTPALNDTTGVTFNYSITDGTASVAQTATLDLLSINDAPTVGAPVVLSDLAEDNSRVITLAELLAGAVDVDGDTLTVTNLTASSGTLVNNNDGTWSFTPAANDNSSVTFNYSVTDGTASVAQTATLDLTPVNDTPTVTATPPSGGLRENPLLGAIAATLSIADPDSDAASRTIELVDNAGGRFMVSGSNIVVANPLLLDFEQASSHDVTVKVSDGDGGVVTQVVTIQLTNQLGETVTGGSGADVIVSDGGADSLNGGGGNDLLNSGQGQDTLNGGSGSDTMLGGAGNDTYIVSSLSDRVFETTTTTSTVDAGGIDTVLSSVHFSLYANAGARFVENLTLTGVLNANGTGNTLANTLIGNTGNNVLNGGSGSDTMLGGAGNDTYVVSSLGDRVFETTTTTSTVDAGGIDTVRSSVHFNLDATAGVRFVENLTLTGTLNANGTGNALANTLIGNTGNNVLNGGLGNDTMTGGAGVDTFVFSTALGATNVDRITDFTVVDDTIRLDDAVFAGVVTGTLRSSAFAANLTGNATDSLDRVIYETDTGRLYFDADGSGAGARVHFATLSANLALTNADFFVF